MNGVSIIYTFFISFPKASAVILQGANTASHRLAAHLSIHAIFLTDCLEYVSYVEKYVFAYEDNLITAGVFPKYNKDVLSKEVNCIMSNLIFF